MPKCFHCQVNDANSQEDGLCEDCAEIALSAIQFAQEWAKDFNQDWKQASGLEPWHLEWHDCHS